MEKVFMEKALELAKKGTGFTFPNPCVGAVIVKGGKIVASGWHKKAGTDHAEVVAIKDLMQKAGIVSRDVDPMLFQNAVLYVTLEPCCHFGKTSPCTNMILKSGLKKVIIGMKDPFKRVNGKGMQILKKHGIEVEICKESSPLSIAIKNINQPFIKWAKTGLPYVILKSGITLDGKIATSTGDSKWITSENSRKDAKLERSKCDAVIVGANTVRKDNPELATFGVYKKKSLLRIILNKKLDLDLNKKVLRDNNVFVACTDIASKKNKNNFKKANIRFKSFGKKDISILKLLKFLGEKGIQSVFVEGGSTLNGAFFDEFLKNPLIIDKILFYIAPKLIGGIDSIPVIGGIGAKKISKALILKKINFQNIEDDLKVEGIINFY